jgi:hypothetical protein
MSPLRRNPLHERFWLLNRPPSSGRDENRCTRAELRLDEWLLAMDWRELRMGARALDCAPTPGRGLG